MTLPTHSHLLPSRSRTPRYLPSPPVQALPTPFPQVVLDQGAQSSSATPLTPLCIPTMTMRRCQLFLQVQHPPYHPPSPLIVLLYILMVKDPGAQSISATRPIPPLLLRDQHPLPTRHLSAFPPVQGLPSPCPLTVKDMGAQYSSSATLQIPLRFLEVLLVPQMMQQGRRFLLVLSPPQRPPLAPPMYKHGSLFSNESL